MERIPGSKHRLRKAKYKVIKVPGKTYALNRKNNEMCGVIFKVWMDECYLTYCKSFCIYCDKFSTFYIVVVYKQSSIFI